MHTRIIPIALALAIAAPVFAGNAKPTKPAKAAAAKPVKEAAPVDCAAARASLETCEASVDVDSCQYYTCFARQSACEKRAWGNAFARNECYSQAEACNDACASKRTSACKKFSTVVDACQEKEDAAFLAGCQARFHKDFGSVSDCKSHEQDVERDEAREKSRAETERLAAPERARQAALAAKGEAEQAEAARRSAAYNERMRATEQRNRAASAAVPAGGDDEEDDAPPPAPKPPEKKPLFPIQFRIGN